MPERELSLIEVFKGGRFARPSFLPDCLCRVCLAATLVEAAFEACGRLFLTLQGALTR